MVTREDTSPSPRTRTGGFDKAFRIRQLEAENERLHAALASAYDAMAEIAGYLMADMTRIDRAVNGRAYRSRAEVYDLAQHLVERAAAKTDDLDQH